MIEIDVIKLVGKKATVAFYFPVPLKNQGKGKTPKNPQLSTEKVKRVEEGEYIEVIKQVKLVSMDSKVIKQQLSGVYEGLKEAALTKHAKSTGQVSYKRVNGIWK